MSTSTCLECGMQDPPPEQTCDVNGTLMDHYVGLADGCPNCGRTVAACVKRPCSVWREAEGR